MMTVEYRRLPGKSRSLFGNATLWLADDHILTVVSHRFTEDYRRFYLADIQALLMRERPGMGLALEIIVATGLILFLVATFFNWWLAPLSLPSFAIYLLHRLRGPMCDCHVVTATGTWPIPALTRLNAARQCVATLRPLIEEQQGAVDASAAIEQGAPLYTGASAATSGRFLAGYAVLFVVALISCGIGVWSLLTPSDGLSGVSFLAGSVTIGVASIVLARSTAAAAPVLRSAALAVVSFKVLKGATVALLWCVLVVGPYSYVPSAVPPLSSARVISQSQALLYCFEGVVALASIVGTIAAINDRRRA